MLKKHKRAPREITKANGMQKLKAHYTEFIDRIDSVVQEARKQGFDTHREFSHALAEIDGSFEKHRTEKLQKYLDSVEKSRGDRDERKLIQLAHVSAEDELKKLHENLSKQYEGVVSKRQQDLESLRQQAHEKIHKTFHDYLASVKESWEDEKMFDPENVALLGEMLTTTALKTRSLLET